MRGSCPYRGTDFARRQRRHGNFVVDEQLRQSTFGRGAERQLYWRDVVGLSSGPGTTGSDGTTTAAITANLDGYLTPGTGSCTFTTPRGHADADGQSQGVSTSASPTRVTPLAVAPTSCCRLLPSALGSTGGQVVLTLLSAVEPGPAYNW